MKDLLCEYQETKKALNRLQRHLKQADDAERLVRLNAAKRLTGRAKAVSNGPSHKGDRRLVEEMIGSVDYVIEWLETGRQPGNRRGIERRAGYERERPMDPALMQVLFSYSAAGSPCPLDKQEAARLECVLSSLTERERECFVLTHGECFSLEEVAQLLGITKSSVQTYISRAQNKIAQRIASSLVLAG
ncbi:sigma-70 family RNA polymerase sigma factor [Brevibacillus massiliensis]|uniref:sigma-70 family RNA polymerase sigma factor n=1 Tax=Brevibacillus massiliensis TaxID=1118054 RepID=UPI0002FBB058|nr:sigma-70 family RNA polymerase sigma factor [Brevibacillus massiliensis]